MDKSDGRGKQILVDPVENLNWITKLPNEVLLLILSKMPTERAVQTSVLSKWWENVWKDVPRLIFDMRKTITLGMESVAVRSDYIAQLITKVINNHNGYLDYCRIHNFSYQSKDSTMLETWIRTLTHVKHTKGLALQNLLGHREGARVLNLSPNIFSHPLLKILFLFRYDLETAHAFNNCNNLTILKLNKTCAEVGVFNTVIASCPSLKVLVLDITWYNRIGCLKIHHNNIKLLDLACTYIDRIEVFAALLDIFSINNIFVARKNFVLAAPRLLQFNKKHWGIEEKKARIISYNISCNAQVQAQEEENIGHEYAVSRNTKYLQKFTCLVVSLDLGNPKEVDMLKEVFVAWGGEMRKLEIFFKHNVSKEECESFIGGAQKKKWEEEKLFPSANFPVQVVWLYNLSNKDDFALASYIVTQSTVLSKMMINISSDSANKKLEIEGEVTKLIKLPRGNKDLSIECF